MAFVLSQNNLYSAGWGFCRYFIVNIKALMFCVSSLCFTSYSVPIPDLGDRASITLSLLLTAVAYKLVLADILPRVSYLTALDKYVLICFTMLIVIAAEQGLAAWISNENSPWWGLVGTSSFDEQSVDKFEMWFQLALGVFWSIYNIFDTFSDYKIYTRNKIDYGEYEQNSDTAGNETNGIGDEAPPIEDWLVQTTTEAELNEFNDRRGGNTEKMQRAFNEIDMKFVPYFVAFFLVFFCF